MLGEDDKMIQENFPQEICISTEKIDKKGYYKNLTKQTVGHLGNTHYCMLLLFKVWAFRVIFVFY